NPNDAGQDNSAGLLRLPIRPWSFWLRGFPGGSRRGWDRGAWRSPRPRPRRVFSLASKSGTGSNPNDAGQDKPAWSPPPPDQAVVFLASWISWRLQTRMGSRSLAVTASTAARAPLMVVMH